MKKLEVLSPSNNIYFLVDTIYTLSNSIHSIFNFTSTMLIIKINYNLNYYYNYYYKLYIIVIILIIRLLYQNV
jgi:hypothetical protein